MNRRTVAAVIVACLGVIAIGVAAATLTTPVSPETYWSGNYSGEDDITGGHEIEEPDVPEDRPLDSLDSPWIQTLLISLPLLGALGCVLYVLVYNRAVIPYVVGAAILIVLLYVTYRLGTWMYNTVTLPTVSLPFGTGDTIPVLSSGDSTRLVLTAVILFGAVLLGTTLAVTGTLPWVNRSPTTGDSDRSETAVLGEAAGRAADRIEGEFETAVHRAWYEMTTLLDVSPPDSTTPGEFEAAAIDAGMNASDVQELTQLFEDVRYGGYSPTTDREEYARTLFRRIEAEYKIEEQ